MQLEEIIPYFMAISILGIGYFFNQKNRKTQNFRELSEINAN